MGNPEFGSDLTSVIFEQEGDDIESKVEEAIRSSMSRFLPFIIIDEIETAFSDRNPNVVNVSISFSINIDTTEKEKLSFDVSTY